MHPIARLVPAAAAVALAACTGAAPGSLPAPASEAEWRALATRRPEPLPGAARVSLVEVILTGEPAWASGAPVPASLALEELVAAGLLERRDVHFVERRRFAAAAAAERAGTPRPSGAPRAGVSAGAELLATATFVSLPGGEGSVEVRLSDARTGAVWGTAREVVPNAAEPVALARAVVSALLAVLDAGDRLPPWEDPVAPSGGMTGDDTSADAVRSFLRGLAAEERWDWESARIAYQVAARAPGFHEASAALARTARLRLGGTLGES